MRVVRNSENPSRVFNEMGSGEEARRKVGRQGPVGRRRPPGRWRSAAGADRAVAGFGGFLVDPSPRGTLTLPDLDRMSRHADVERAKLPAPRPSTAPALPMPGPIRATGTCSRSCRSTSSTGIGPPKDTRSGLLAGPNGRWIASADSASGISRGGHTLPPILHRPIRRSCARISRNRAFLRRRCQQSG
jgi:hypothetical protein